MPRPYRLSIRRISPRHLSPRGERPHPVCHPERSAAQSRGLAIDGMYALFAVRFLDCARNDNGCDMCVGLTAFGRGL